MSQPSTPVLKAILASLQSEADTKIRDARIGPYWNAVLSRRCGLASTPHETHDRQVQRPSFPAEQLVGRQTLEIAEWSLSSDGFIAAIGMAAINSLLEPDESRCKTINARDLLLQHAAGRSIAIVGHFPFVDDIRAVAERLWVLELNPRPGDLPAEQAPDVIPQADIVALTGVTLINHTFDDLIALCRPDAYVVMLGGSTPLSPVLFDYGVDVIGGTIVDDPILVMEGIAQGATFRELRGKHPVLMFKERVQ